MEAGGRGRGRKVESSLGHEQRRLAGHKGEGHGMERRAWVTTEGARGVRGTWVGGERRGPAHIANERASLGALEIKKTSLGG